MEMLKYASACALCLVPKPSEPSRPFDFVLSIKQTLLAGLARNGIDTSKSATTSSVPNPRHAI